MTVKQRLLFHRRLLALAKNPSLVIHNKLFSFEQYSDIVLYLLQEFTQLLAFLGRHCPGVCHSSMSETEPNDPSSLHISDYLPKKYLYLLNCQLKSSTDDAGRYFPWISQYRLYHVLIHCKAFQELSTITNILALYFPKFDSTFSSSQEKNCKLAKFWINLSNLMSIHASIVMPWSDLYSNHLDEVWLHAVKYRLGRQSVSLHQIRHVILGKLVTGWDVDSSSNDQVCFLLR